MTKTVKHNIIRSYVTPVRTRDRDFFEEEQIIDQADDQARADKRAADLGPYGKKWRETTPFSVKIGGKHD